MQSLYQHWRRRHPLTVGRAAKGAILFSLFASAIAAAYMFAAGLPR